MPKKIAIIIAIAIISAGAIAIYISLIRQWREEVRLSRELRREVQDQLQEVKEDFPQAQRRARDVRRIAEVGQLSQGVLLYANDHDGRLPKTLEDLAPTYIRQVPKDPLTGSLYEYIINPDGRSFEVCAQLEQGGQHCEAKEL